MRIKSPTKMVWHLDVPSDISDGTQRAKFTEKVHKPLLWVNVIILKEMDLYIKMGPLESLRLQKVMMH